MPTYRDASKADWPAIKLLLNDSGLPLNGVWEHLSQFIVCMDKDEIVGCIGAEVRGEAALLRSLAVAIHAQGGGIGTKLVGRLLTRLKAQGVRDVGLLTMTAGDFFTALGFVAVARDRIPSVLHISEEFKGACPDSATAMLLRI